VHPAVYHVKIAPDKRKPAVRQYCCLEYKIISATTQYISIMRNANIIIIQSVHKKSEHSGLQIILERHCRTDETFQSLIW